MSGVWERTGGVMFTGIVEEKGTIRYIQLIGESGVLAVKAKKVLEGTKIGDSIAVNGICLTVTSLQSEYRPCEAHSERCLFCSPAVTK